jgi:hypothetical protein
MRKLHEHECRHCEKVVLSYEEKHESLKVSCVECVYEACKEVRKKVKESC